MNQDNATTQVTRLSNALRAGDASARLQAALTAGIHADDASLPILISRCAVEPDFYVRDMLTWAITRHDRSQAVDLLLPELGSVTPQARSQALHSLSKIRDPRAWPAITVALLRDPDEDVAKTAWRVAAGLAPERERADLARELGRNFGRGDGELRQSLSRAIAMLGPAAEPVVEEASESEDPDVRAHALATAHVMANPDDSFEAAVEEARRVVALRAAPAIEDH
ncbi:HEAT repeat domain-containing protein [Microbacterium sp. HD4P20]|uniref:HEAT repeat domain-containing protein n=1 Tax=Microbacterium sp. HD4P20 TaxID=2864874 RepID=UPI001C63C04A|nr:HEAT repeat domain-containing protein [Microbacterium sp. HD4P20]MCP2635622.1 HEAT repeat domain-containing protein [Microbacterium sp. HD4P20]